MTTKNYGGITDAEIVPGQPITTSLVQRLRDDALGVLQNSPASQAANLIGNFISRMTVLTTPLASTGYWVVPDGVRKVLVIVCGAGGCGSDDQGSGSGGVRGNGGITYFVNGSTGPRAGGGHGFNSTSAHARAFDCLFDLAGMRPGWRDGHGGDTIFGPGAGEDQAAEFYGAGGGPPSTGGLGGGAAAIGVAIVNVTPGASIAYEIGRTYEPEFLVGGGNAGGQGVIILGY